MIKPSNTIGSLNPAVISENFINKAIEFIWDSLIPWKNDFNRPEGKAEKALNSSLCTYLALHAPNNFPMGRFAHEEPQRGQRAVDLAVKPASVITISSYKCTPYNPAFVMECKRLPAPRKDRECEYVTGKNGEITGGIQRFKLGEHGEFVTEAMIIGYIQQHDHLHWYNTINEWISELSVSEPETWNSSEILMNASFDSDGERARFLSCHDRKGCRTPNIPLHHFWIKLSSE